MAALFISHSGADQAATERICERLRAEGLAALFVDFDAHQGIPAGRNWERELYSQVRMADAVVFLSSPASVASNWCFAEVALARLLRKPIFPIVIEASPRHPLLGDTQHIDLFRDGETWFQRLWVGLRMAGLDPRTTFEWDPARPPYPGLMAFTEQDAAVFFGRERETEHLLELLQPGFQGRGRFVAVVGPSGSGKSSLVRAGLLPRLPQSWLIVPRLVPGKQPARQLARRLAQAFKDRGAVKEPSELAAQLIGGTSALVAILEELRDVSAEEPTSLLLVIDQAEELVTMTGEAEHVAFLELLHGTVHNAAGVWVLATVRAEFLGRLLQQPGTADLLDEVVPISPLNRSRLFAVIERPAARAGLQFEPGLVGRLVEDTHGGDALPLLAFTLRQMFEQVGPDAQITTKTYEANGGVVGALRAQADRIATMLANQGYGELVVPTLTSLATVAGKNDTTRRVVPRSTLTEAENQVVQVFIDARLLVSSTDEQGAAVVEVAHEALLRQWPPLREAIEARRDELHLRTELERWVLDWERAGRQDSYLIGGDRLEAAQRWTDEHPQELPRLPGVNDFIVRSASQHQLTMELRSEAVASRALAEIDRDLELATLLAIAAVEEYGSSARATLALRAVLTTPYQRVTLRGHQRAVAGVAFSPDGTLLATASSDNTARLWEVASGAEQRALVGRDFDIRYGTQLRGVTFSPDGTLLASATNSRIARLWEVASGAELQPIRGHEGALWGVAFSPDGTLLATASDDKTARIWKVARRATLRLIRGHLGLLRGVAFSPDGTLLATASSDNTARIWDAASGTFERILTRHYSTVTGVAFSPDGTLLATASSDNTARICEVASGAELRRLRGHEGALWGVAFSPDSSRLATASEDGTARIWEVGTGAELQTLRGHEQAVAGVAFSPDGTLLATASYDNTARLWEVASLADLKTLRSHEDVLPETFPEGSLLTRARMRVNRQLTSDERQMVGLPL